MFGLKYIILKAPESCKRAVFVGPEWGFSTMCWKAHCSSQRVFTKIIEGFSWMLSVGLGYLNCKQKKCTEITAGHLPNVKRLLWILSDCTQTGETVKARACYAVMDFWLPMKSEPVSVPIFYPLHVQSDFVRPHIHPIVCLLLGAGWSHRGVKLPGTFSSQSAQRCICPSAQLHMAGASPQFQGRIVKAPGHGEDMKKETRSVGVRCGTC